MTDYNPKQHKEILADDYNGRDIPRYNNKITEAELIGRSLDLEYNEIMGTLTTDEIKKFKELENLLLI